jgi:hypothetical protein
MGVSSGDSTIKAFDKPLPTESYTFSDMASFEKSILPQPHPPAFPPDQSTQSVPDDLQRVSPTGHEPNPKRSRRVFCPPTNLQDYVTTMSLTSTLPTTPSYSPLLDSTFFFLAIPPLPPTPYYDPAADNEELSLNDYIHHTEPANSYHVNAAFSSSRHVVRDSDNSTLKQAQNSDEWNTFQSHMTSPTLCLTPACFTNMSVTSSSLSWSMLTTS